MQGLAKDKDVSLDFLDTVKKEGVKTKVRDSLTK